MFKKINLIFIFFSLFIFKSFSMNWKLKENLFLRNKEYDFDTFFSKNSITLKDLETGISCMHIAMVLDNRYLINYLFKKNIFCDLPDKFGYTPIDWAYIANNKKLIKSCQKAGLSTYSKFKELYKKINRKIALPNYAEILIDSILFFPDEDALERSFFIAECLGLEPIKKYLINNYNIDTDMHRLDENGMTYLHKAVIWQDYLLTKYFFESGINYKVKDSKGRTALDLAKKKNNNLAILDFLSEYIAVKEPFLGVLF